MYSFSVRINGIHLSYHARRGVATVDTWRHHVAHGVGDVAGKKKTGRCHFGNGKCIGRLKEKTTFPSKKKKQTKQKITKLMYYPNLLRGSEIHQFAIELP